MTDDTKLKLVETGSIFDDLEGLRRVTSLKVVRKTVTTSVAVGRPPNNVFFRAHPSPDMQLDCGILIGNSRDETFFVAPRMLGDPRVVPRMRRVTLTVVITWPSGAISLWPVPKEPRVASQKSERRAYEIATEQWCQLVWNDDKRDFDLIVAEGIDIDPAWPADLDFAQLLRLAYPDDKVIGTPEHSYVQQLRGLA